MLQAVRHTAADTTNPIMTDMIDTGVNASGSESAEKKESVKDGVENMKNMNTIVAIAETEGTTIVHLRLPHHRRQPSLIARRGHTRAPIAALKQSENAAAKTMVDQTDRAVRTFN